MKRNFKFLIASLMAFAATIFTAAASDALDATLQAKVDAQVKQIASWASDPVIVNAVKAQNASLPSEFGTMTQEKWTALTVLDPFVRSFTKNEAGLFLKDKRAECISRMFLCDANGIKVAFTTKTLSWSHKGDPKHETPMAGKTWQGPLEQDKATGLLQIQVAVPVLDGGKPVGSLVVSLSLEKLKE
jgi:hypothetical protein